MTREPRSVPRGVLWLVLSCLVGLLMITGTVAGKMAYGWAANVEARQQDQQTRIGVLERAAAVNEERLKLILGNQNEMMELLRRHMGLK